MIRSIFHFLTITLKFQLAILSKLNIANSAEWGDYGQWPHTIPITALTTVTDINNRLKTITVYLLLEAKAL